MRVAVVGKGGAGKSVVAGTMARLLARSGHKVLALDSDPIPGLAISLGLGPVTTPMLLDAVEKNDKGRWRLKKGVGGARAVQRYSLEGPDGVRLLQLGKANADGLKDAMGSVNGFYQVVHRLARDGTLSGWTIVGDLPAGPRQAAYDWVPYADRLVLVVEPTWQSILTARRIARLGRARSGVEVVALGNKLRQQGDVELIEERLGEPVVGTLPFDPAIAEADARGKAPIDHAPDSPAVRAIEDLIEALSRRSVTV